MQNTKQFAGIIVGGFCPQHHRYWCIKNSFSVHTESNRKGAGLMRKNGWLLLLVLLCVAFLVSCGKDNSTQEDKGELIRMETEGYFLPSFVLTCQNMVDII